MAEVACTLMGRDAEGKPLAGLAPKWVFFVTLNGDPPKAIDPPPDITEIGPGLYRFKYDPALRGEATGLVDMGEAVTVPWCRYLEASVTDDTSGNLVTLARLPDRGQVASVLSVLAAQWGLGLDEVASIASERAKDGGTAG